MCCVSEQQTLSQDGQVEAVQFADPAEGGFQSLGSRPGQHVRLWCHRYALSHIGHARAAVNFDVLYRYLDELGYKVTYVRNFTDVDDKIIHQANKLGEVPISLSNRFCQEYTNDMADLQCRPPTHEPRVSDHMEQIKDMITQIINNDYAYVVDGMCSLLLRSSQIMANYLDKSWNILEQVLHCGSLQSLESLESQVGTALGDEEGRGAWHIECSAMSAHYLSFKFDIHGGGIDLIFPHHENEIAQSCAACQESRVGYWLHNGHVTNNNEKMSKSVGNFFTIRQITERYHPLSLRHFLLSAHYRSPLNYSVSQLESASDAVYYMYDTLQKCEDALSPLQEKEGAVQISEEAEGLISKLKNEFETKMSNDLNTASILTGALHDALRYINRNTKPLKKKHPKQQQQLYKSRVETKKAVEKVLDTLGLLSCDTYSEVVQQLKAKALIRAGLSEDDVLRTIAERTLARKNKDFARSDQMRDEMEEKGIQFNDLDMET